MTALARTKTGLSLSFSLPILADLPPFSLPARVALPSCPIANLSKTFLNPATGWTAAVPRQLRISPALRSVGAGVTVHTISSPCIPVVCYRYCGGCQRRCCRRDPEVVSLPQMQRHMHELRSGVWGREGAGPFPWLPPANRRRSWYGKKE